MEFDLLIDVICIGVEVVDWIVMFLGYLFSYVEKFVIECVVNCVGGVKVFVVDMIVYLLDDDVCIDEDIVKVVCFVLYWMVGLYDDVVKV